MPSRPIGGSYQRFVFNDMKETYYFQHDYHARHDLKLESVLLGEVGVAGIGIFWCIIEMLYEENGYALLSHMGRIANALRVEEKLIKSIVFDFELFQYDEKMFWSDAVLRRLNERRNKSKSARNSAKVRWNNANAMRTQCDGNAIKEKKVKEIVSEGDKSPHPPLKGNGSLTPAEEMRDFCGNTEKQQKVVEYLFSHGFNQETAKNEVNKFIDYWTEKTKSGKAERWEGEKTFEVKKRLSTWIKKYEQFNAKK